MIEFDVPYLPLPNRVEIVISDEVCDPALTRTAFMVPVFDDGSVLMAQNARRGIEIPGGHVEPGESLVEAAIREAFEEVGCRVADIRPIGFLRMTSEGEVPDDWAYPHPVSYQQFFAGRIVEQLDYSPNDECLDPIRTDDLSTSSRSSVLIFTEHARSIFRSPASSPDRP